LLHEKLLKAVCLSLLILVLTALLLLILSVFLFGFSRLTPTFLTSFPSRHPEQAGILAALAGTVWLMVLTALFALPVGIGAAVYLEEYGSRGRYRDSWMLRLVELNLANLASVPSVVFGLLGLAIFVRFLGFGQSLLSGSLTLALLALPIIIISSREALRAVPSSIREASYALGANQWQTITRQVLPIALPGMLTGTILALARAIGETAPLILVGALAYVAFVPDGVFSPFTAIPVQTFNWISRPQAGFHANAAAAIALLLPLILLMNGVAIWVRERYQSKSR
jgi:phosphate transport system permease protein